MQFRTMSTPEAAHFVSDIDEMSDEAFADLANRWIKHEVEDVPEEYALMRTEIVKTFDSAKASGKYNIDIEVGFKLYQLLSPTIHFDNVTANNDDVWRFISCRIFPDITYLRYPKPSKGDLRLNKDRFYAGKRRIWLKTLWWYIHLSWQGNEEETRAVLNGLGSDTISDLVERTGKGYRLPLYREMMRAYTLLPNKSTDLFNAVMKRNLVDCRTIEPALTKNGERGYAESLMAKVKV